MIAIGTIYWTPVIGQVLLVKREPTKYNLKDKNAVALYEDDSVI